MASPLEPQSTQVTATPPEQAPAQPPPQALASAAGVAPQVPERLREQMVRLDSLLAGLVVALAFLLALFPIRNSDVYPQLAVGRLICQGEYHPGADPFTWGSQPSSWLNGWTGGQVVWVNHSWLFGLGAYGLYLLAPAGAGLVVTKAQLMAVLAGLLMAAGRRPGQRLWLPALCTVLALLALSPRLYFQPVVVSYLFLGLTFWMVDRPRRLAQTNRRIWWLLPLVFVLWVNFDQWFFIGLVLIGLYAVGLAWHKLTHPAAEKDNGAGRLGLVLVACLAASLVNPQFAHVFTLPAQLTRPGAAAMLAGDAGFRPLFLSPFKFDDLPALGLSVASLSYYVLLLVAVASFVLQGLRAAASWSWPRVFIFVAFALVSAYHARAIPFFAIVAGPIAALNFLDVVASSTSSVSLTRGFWPRWLVLGRALSILAVLALSVATVPGWLHAQRSLHRVGWTLEQDESMQQVAQQIAQWRQRGLLHGEVRWFNTQPEAADGFAWFCPGEKTLLDRRLGLYGQAAGDYVKVRRALVTPPQADDPSTAFDWRQLLRDRDVRFLVVTSAEPLQTPLLGVLLSNPREWALLYMDGRNSLFGWIDPKARRGADPYAGMRLNVDHLAFGPEAPQVPDQPPESRPIDRPWYEEIWEAPPRRPLDAFRAQAYLLYYRARINEGNQANMQALLKAQAAGLVGLAAQCLNPLMTYPALVSQKAWVAQMGGLQVERQLARMDAGPPAALYVALRAARRALVENPNDARLHLDLALVYETLAQQTTERIQTEASGEPMRQLLQIRQAQMMAHLARAVQLDPDLEEAHGQLTVAFNNMGYVDLVLKHFREQLRCVRQRGRRPGETLQQAEERMKENLKTEQLLASRLDERQKDYNLRAGKLHPLQQAQLALQRQGPADRKAKPGEEHRIYALAEQALAALEQARQEPGTDKPEERAAVERAANLRLLEMWFRLGQLDKVRENLTPEVQKTLGLHPEFGLPAAAVFELWLAAADGDYRRAEESLDDMLEALCGPSRTKVVSTELGKLVGQMLLQEAAQASGMTPWPGRMVELQLNGWVLQNQAVRLGQERQSREAELRTLRGWISLEAGHLDGARTQLQQTLALCFPPEQAAPWLLRLGAATPLEQVVVARVNQAQGRFFLHTYPGRPLALMGMRWLEENQK
jgi:hypothetical protein